MVITAQEYELLEAHGFSIMRDSGRLLFWDDQTEEAYQPQRAISMAIARNRENRVKNALSGEHLPPGYTLIGIRMGTLASRLAAESFSEVDWVCLENDPKGTEFGLVVYRAKPEDIDCFMDIYMTVSGRDKS